MGNQWSNNIGGKGSYIPHSDRDCYKCGGKGHIAANCPQGPKTANEVEQQRVNTHSAATEQPTALGQPLNCDSVEMRDEINAVPAPPTAQEIKRDSVDPSEV